MKYGIVHYGPIAYHHPTVFNSTCKIVAELPHGKTISLWNDSLRKMGVDIVADQHVEKGIRSRCCWIRCLSANYRKITRKYIFDTHEGNILLNNYMDISESFREQLILKLQKGKLHQVIQGDWFHVTGRIS